jgi:hypothetical protein
MVATMSPSRPVRDASRAALEPVLVGAAPLGLVPAGDAMGALARVLQAGVGPVEVGLLGVEFGMAV